MEEKSTIKLLNINQLYEHPLNQEIFDTIPEEKKKALKLSIQQNGLINPLTVMAFKKNGKNSYYVVSGHNRLSILKETGAKQAPCKIIFPKRQGQDLDILITDNLLQRDLSVTEKARAIYYMSETLKLSRDEVQNKLGISIRFIQASMQLMRMLNELDDKTREMTIQKLHSINGINRAVQIVKKIAYGESAPKKRYTTKDDIISFMKEEIEKKDKEIKKLERTIKRRDKRIAKLKSDLENVQNLLDLSKK